MQKVEITIEELQDLATNAARKAVEEHGKNSINDLFGLLGLENDKEGREVFRSLGRFARMWSRFGDEAEKKSISWFVKAIGLMILGMIALFISQAKGIHIPWFTSIIK